MNDRTSADSSCQACRDGTPLAFDVTMAFQPIIDLRDRSVFAHEALVRGLDGEGAPEMLGKVDTNNRYRFDQTCRIKAVELATQLGVPGHVCINFLPNAVYDPATCIRATLAAAKRYGLPVDRLIFEVNEHEEMVDKAHLKNIFREYQRQGFKTAIDDFGAGHSGLNLLAEFQPDIIKLDIALVHEIDRQPVRQAIVRGIIGVCETLGIEVIAEGVETVEVMTWLHDLGINLFQGFLFARPATGALPEIAWPDAA